jgi:hypothetical protein
VDSITLLLTEISSTFAPTAGEKFTGISSSIAVCGPIIYFQIQILMALQMIQSEWVYSFSDQLRLEWQSVACAAGNPQFESEELV